MASVVAGRASKRAVTSNGNRTHFVFAIPDNFAAFKEALVIVLGKTTKAYTYDQNLSLASDGDNQAAMEFLILGTPDASIEGIVHELDVSAIFCLPTLTAGMDYVSLGLACEELEYVDTHLRVVMSVHVGLNGTGPATSDRITGWSSSGWKWSNETMDAPRATIEVTVPGDQVLNLWMREDGTQVDKIVLTTSSSLVPTSLGPPESPRGSP